MLAPLLFVSSGSAFEGLSHKSSFSRFTSSHSRPNRDLRALWSGPHRYSPFGGELSALEALIRPQVSPVSIAPAIGDTEIIEIAVNSLECSRTVEVEDDVGVWEQHRASAQETVVLAEVTTAAEIPEDRLNPVIR